MKFTLKAILLLLITIFAIAVDSRRTHKRRHHSRRTVANECATNCASRGGLRNAYQCTKSILCECGSGYIVGKNGSYTAIEPSKVQNIKPEIQNGNCKRQ